MQPWLEFGAGYQSDAGVEASAPMERAYPLLFLCSDAAAYIAGVTLISDAGYISSGIAGAYPAATEAVRPLDGPLVTTVYPRSHAETHQAPRAGWPCDGQGHPP